MSLTKPFDKPRIPAVVSVSPRDTVLEAVKRMRDDHVGFLVVCDGEERVVGVLTDRDVTCRVIAKGLCSDALPVSAVMTSSVVTLPSGRDLSDAALLMRNHRVRRLPVVDPAGRVIGVVSTDDVVHHIASRVTALDRILEREMDNEENPRESLSGRSLGKE